MRLFLGYQRYGLLLVGAPVALVALAFAWTSPWLAVPLALAAIAPVRFGVEVLSRWPRKLRATRIGLARLRAGRFRAAQIKPYCGDPCFRLVADELLARAGVARAERRRIIRRYRDELRAERDVLLVVDHAAGTVTEIRAVTGITDITDIRAIRAQERT